MTTTKEKCEAVKNEKRAKTLNERFPNRKKKKEPLLFLAVIPLSNSVFTIRRKCKDEAAAQRFIRKVQRSFESPMDGWIEKIDAS